MKRNGLKIVVFLFFIGLSWACGIGDAFVAEDIESIKDPKERAWAWQVEYFYQAEGRHPTQAEKDSMRATFEKTWRDTSVKTQEKKPRTTGGARKPHNRILSRLLRRNQHHQHPIQQ